MSSHEHGTLHRVRKRRKHSRKLSDNRELLTSVVVLVFCVVLVMAFLTYIISTRACHIPKFLQPGT
jgi:hypothetical protein